MVDNTNYVMCLKIVQGRVRVSVCARLEGSRDGKLRCTVAEDVRCSSQVFTQQWLAYFWKEGRAHSKVTVQSTKGRGYLTLALPHPANT